MIYIGPDINIDSWSDINMDIDTWYDSWFAANIDGWLYISMDGWLDVNVDIDSWLDLNSYIFI